MKRGRRIAFDYGDSRIGVAICDPDGILASPLPFLDARHPRLMKEIEELIQEYEPISIFVGEPRHLSGKSGDAVEKAVRFVNTLRENFNLEVTLIDERLSTVSAARKLKEAGRTTREAKNLIDSMAAVSILEIGLTLENR